MNLQQLRYVVATADHGTMTQAAAASLVAQPALTRAVRALERELGLTLFRRDGRTVAITAEGRVVVDAARRALAEVAAIEDYARRTAGEAVLTIAATPTLQSDLGSGLVLDFWAHHPEVPVRFVHCESPQGVAEAVASGVAEVGMSDLPAPGLVEVPFEWREVVVVAPPGADLPDPLPVASLAGLRLIAPTIASARRVEFDALFADLGVTPTVSFESDERSSWVPAVLAGRGCCLWYRGQGDAAAGLGAEVRSLDPPLGRRLALVHRPGPVPAPVAALLALAAERATAV